MTLKRLFLLICFLGAVLGVEAQILNDSIRNIYGPNTTLFLLEENIKYNIPGLSPIDTSLHGLHNFNFVDRLQRKYQDLGIIGTPMNPIFYSPPDIIGRATGFHSFDPYFIAPEQIKYYDTKSPFSRLYFVIGGNGRSIVNVDYSRNIKANWNVGASIQLISADKQFGTAIRRGDRNADATAYQFHTRYFTKDNRYQLLANFSRLGMKVADSGGIRPNQTSGLLEREGGVPWLTNADSREVRNNIHLYHQYKVSDLVQLYHSFDRTNQNVSFTAPVTADTSSYFAINRLYQFRNAEGVSFFHDQTQTGDSSSFLTYKNEIGFKGDIGPLFYNFYLKRRDLNYDNLYLNSRSFSENYAGFNLRNNFTEDMHFSAFGEYLLGRNYKLGSGFSFRFIEANVKRVRHDPTLLQQLYFGNHLVWNNINDFSPVLSDNFYGAIHLELPFMKISPHINLHRVSRQVYFGEDRLPAQANGAARIFAPGIDLNLRFFRNVHFDNHFVYTNVSGNAANIFRIPRLFLNSRLYYSNSHFNDRLEIQAGVDMHFRSSYYAYGYEPVIQQFYLQNDILIPAFPLADVFINIKISRAQVFLKYTNATHELTKEYFSTPSYFGQQAVFDFGINWLFFD